MNLYEVLIERENSIEVGPGGRREIFSPAVTQLVLADEAGESGTGDLIFCNKNEHDTVLNDAGQLITSPLAAFAKGAWLSFHIVTKNVSADYESSQVWS